MAVFFFGAGWYGFAFLWLIFLWGLVYYCIRTFREFSRNAGYLMVPYLAWLTFAGYLNLFIAPELTEALVYAENVFLL